MMCIEKVEGTNWLWQQAGTEHNVAVCGKSYNTFCKTLGQV